MNPQHVPIVSPESYNSVSWLLPQACDATLKSSNDLVNELFAYYRS